jgi:hypothetical protein
MNIRKIIREEVNGFEWVNDVMENPLDGITFNYVSINRNRKGHDVANQQPLKYTIEDNGGDTVFVHFEGQYKPMSYSREEVQNFFSSGEWVEV